MAADHPGPVEALNDAMARRESDPRVRRYRHGPGANGSGARPRSPELYAQIDRASHLKPAGLHVYDGQNHQTGLEERLCAVEECWNAVQALRDKLESSSLAVPAIVAGGTGTFPLYARKDDPSLELSPAHAFCMTRAICGSSRKWGSFRRRSSWTRVISRPSPELVTFDLGYKACASDPPAGSRLRFPAIPDAKEVLQNEEHLVIETTQRPATGPATSNWRSRPISVRPLPCTRTHRS